MKPLATLILLPLVIAFQIFWCVVVLPLMLIIVLLGKLFGQNIRPD